MVAASVGAMSVVAGAPARGPDAVEQAISIEMRLHKAYKDIERATARMTHAEEEAKRCAQAVRNLRGSVRVLARVRPRLEGEEDDGDCFRILGSNHLEIRPAAGEPPQPLMVGWSRSRRRASTGGIGEVMATRLDGDADSSFTSPGVARPAAERRTFAFDCLFGSEAADEEVFAAVRDEVRAALDGEAACIFAYGAANSGKSHTLMALAERAAQELERVAAERSLECVEVEAEAQVIEVHNEHLRDLLSAASAESSGAHEPSARPTLSSLPTSDASSMLRDAVSWTCRARTSAFQNSCAGDAAAETQLGFHAMLQAADARSNSSRSHVVATFRITHRDVATGAIQKAGRLSLVDLASAEPTPRRDRSCARAQDHPAEDANRALHALADVLVAREKRCTHVPYRNSRLTQLLQDVLGGQQQCHTVVLVALPPTQQNSAESLQSLHFAARLASLAPKPCASLATGGTTVGGHVSWSAQGMRRQSLGESARLCALQDMDPVEDFALREEVERLRRERERLRAGLEDCGRALADKEAQMHETLRKNAEMRSASCDGRGRALSPQALLLSNFNRVLQQATALCELPTSDITLSPRPAPPSARVGRAPPPSASATAQPRDSARARMRPTDNSAPPRHRAPSVEQTGAEEASSRRTSPPRGKANNVSGLNACRIQPVLRTSRSVGLEPSTRLGNSVPPQHPTPQRRPPPGSGPTPSSSSSSFAAAKKEVARSPPPRPRAQHQRPPEVAGRDCSATVVGRAAGRNGSQSVERPYRVAPGINASRGQRRPAPKQNAGPAVASSATPSASSSHALGAASRAAGGRGSPARQQAPPCRAPGRRLGTYPAPVDASSTSSLASRCRARVGGSGGLGAGSAEAAELEAGRDEAKQARTAAVPTPARARLGRAAAPSAVSREAPKSSVPRLCLAPAAAPAPSAVPPALSELVPAAQESSFLRELPRFGLPQEPLAHDAGPETRPAVPSLCLGGLPRRCLGPPSRQQEVAQSTSCVPRGTSASSTSSSEDASSSPSSSSSGTSDCEGGTPAARQRAAEAARTQANKVSLRLDLSRVLPPSSARQPLFQATGLEQQGPMLTPSTPRGREPVRRQEVASGPEAAAGPPPPTPRSATVVPLTARGAMPSQTASAPAAHSVPRSAASRTSSQPGGTAACSSSRRPGGNSHEYVLEVLTPARARELVAPMATPRGTVPPAQTAASDMRSPQSPGSPPLMLRPCEPVLEAPDDSAISPGSVSASSSEGEIRDRLRLGLRTESNQSLSQDVEKVTEHFAQEAVKPSTPDIAVLPLAAGIPTPLRSRLSVSSNIPESTDSGDSDDGDESDEGPAPLLRDSHGLGRPMGDFEVVSALMKLEADSAWLPPPTPRRP